MIELQRLLWQFEAGSAGAGQLEERFREAIAELITEYRQGHKQSVAVGARTAALSIAFDQAVNATRHQVVAHDFRTAVTSLQKATAGLRELKITGAAQKEIERAQKLSQDLLRAIGPESALHFMTSEVVSRLLVKAQELFDQGEARQSRFVALMCLHELEELLRVGQASASEAAELQAQMMRTKELEETLRLVPLAPTEPFAPPVPCSATGGSIEQALVRIERLVAEGRIPLARRLLDVVETVTASRSGFVQELTRQAGDLKLAGRDRLAQLLQQHGVSEKDSWESATTRLLQGDLARVANQVSKLHSATVRASATVKTAETESAKPTNEAVGEPKHALSRRQRRALQKRHKPPADMQTSQTT